jgi:antitoxin VapB
MTRSTVFTTNRSQAVRFPRAVAFPASVHQVEIIKIGHSRLVNPVGKRWDDLFTSGPRACDDFMSEREQPAVEEREPLWCRNTCWTRTSVSIRRSRARGRVDTRYQ